MSRIRGIEVRVQKEVLQTRKYGLNEILKKETEERAVDPEQSSDSKDDAEKQQIGELLQKLPQLDEVFEVHRKIGEGTFSSVYLGSLRRQAAARARRWFAIKHLVPTAHPARVEHELRCLRDIGGKHNVIGVDLCLRHLDTIVFIMPYIPHKKFSEYVGEMDAEEVRCYMRALLTALKHVHSFGVIHRDVKPSNFLYDRENRRYLLVDFGLAQRLCPPAAAGPPAPPAHVAGRKRPREEDDRVPLSKRVAAAAACRCAGRGGVCGLCESRAAARAARAGTQGYRPPEVLLKVAAQGTAVDAWAAGVVLASALSTRYPFLRAPSDAAALAELADLLGTQAIASAAKALGRRVVTSCYRRGLCLRKLSARLRAPPPPAPPAAPACARCRQTQRDCLCRDETKKAEEFDPAASVAGFPDSAFALAALLLQPEPARRISAADALNHPFLQEH